MAAVGLYLFPSYISCIKTKVRQDRSGRRQVARVLEFGIWLLVVRF